MAIFVIHEHFARKHHFDLRLEYKGVLKSFAIPKDIPLKQGIRRLAVQVEDHSLSYANFEGEIPKGQYGAGKVLIWDKGNYETIKKTDKEWVVKFDGKKIKGLYALIKFKNNNWLFFKSKG